jgi:hypothetical protein
VSAKYHLMGGSVFARDGDVHFVSAPKLADLYGLNRGEWISCYMDRPCLDTSAVHLGPKENGDYSLPAPSRGKEGG